MQAPKIRTIKCTKIAKVDVNCQLLSNKFAEIPTTEKCTNDNFLASDPVQTSDWHPVIQCDLMLPVLQRMWDVNPAALLLRSCRCSTVHLLLNCWALHINSPVKRSNEYKCERRHFSPKHMDQCLILWKVWTRWRKCTAKRKSLIYSQSFQHWTPNPGNISNNGSLSWRWFYYTICRFNILYKYKYN